MNGLLLSDDLIFTSKITATARAHGLIVRVAKTPDRLVQMAAEQPPSGVILDLHNPGLSGPAGSGAGLDLMTLVIQLRAAGPVRVTAYGSHVDTERLKAARQAGCDRVLARSAFVEQLEDALPTWLGVSDTPIRPIN